MQYNAAWADFERKTRVERNHMKVQISKDVSNDPQLQPLVDRANRLLEEMFGAKLAPLRIEWSRDVPKGLNFVNLDLVDDDTGARGTTVFAPPELTREQYLRARLERVWSDLLQDLNHRQLARLLGTDGASLK